ncbi:hypothetical protein J6590_084801 [Homalodisca vitripennis]|nr:hypothetical protein J6590_084801 [Homalodisca vitripennis]
MEARRAFSLTYFMPRGAGELDTPLHQRLEWRDEVIVPRGERAQQSVPCNMEARRAFSLMSVMPRGAGQLDTPLHQRLEWRDELTVGVSKSVSCNMEARRAFFADFFRSSSTSNLGIISPLKTPLMARAFPIGTYPDRPTFPTSDNVEQSGTDLRSGKYRSEMPLGIQAQLVVRNRVAR